MAGTGAAITDASGNAWTISAGAQVALNGTAVPDTANVTELAYVSGIVWQENASDNWYSIVDNGGAVSTGVGPTTTSPLPATTAAPVPAAPPAATPTATPTSTPAANPTAASIPTPTATPDPTAASTPTPTATPDPAGARTTDPAAAGTRDPSQTPFASDSVFNLPLGSGAQWQPNAQLSSANAYINTASASGYNENIYTGTASDPLVTVTNSGASSGSPGTFQVHIPAGAVPAPGNDATLAVDDTSSDTWYSFGGFQWTGSNTASVSQGSAEQDNGSGIADDNSNEDEGVGTLRESDLQAGTIDHMLRVEMPTDMLESYSQSSTSVLAPYAWPQTAEDGFAINGNGGPAYSGTIPYGVTIGIPASAVEPAAVAANAGANMLWQELQDHGAMVRDSGGSGNTVIFQADQNVDPNDPLIQGMEQYSSQIMAAAEILTNQGPNSINGGGTPIVPLDPTPSDAPGGSSGAVSGAAAVTAGPVATTGTTPTGTTTTIAASQSSATVSQSQVSVVATAGNHMLFTSGSGNQVNLSGGTDTINDSGSGNTYVLPAAGNGSDTFAGTFTSNILTANDTLDLRTALAATDWNGASSTLSNYLTVTDSAQGATLSIAPTSGAAGVVIATIGGASSANLSSVLAHALT
jgi:hypothetical protein